MTLQPFTATTGRALWHMGALLQFKVLGADTGGQYWLAEQTSAQGYSSPVHRHANEDELFVVLDGELHVRVGEDPRHVPAGGVAFAPRGLAHTFTVESATARFLILTTPAGFEDWFFETGTPAESLTLPPPMTEPPDVGKLVSSLQDYDVELIAPPPGA